MASNDDSWISLLVVAVGIVFSVIQSLTKKPEDKKKAMTPPVFDPYEEEEPEEEKPIFETPSIFKQEPVEEAKTTPLFAEGGSITEHLQQKSETMPVQESPKAEIMEEEEENISFDARKALIYSEIFNRKYV